MTADPADEALLNEWLLEWEERFERGEDITPEALCGDRADMLEELRRRIILLRAFDATPAVPADGTGPTARTSASCRAQFLDLKLHAQGGLGEVYGAYNAEFRRQVALKFLKPEYEHNGESRERFRGEAEVTARLEHPGIVPIYGMGEDDAGHPCYAMRFIRGLPMDEAIRSLHGADDPGLEPSRRNDLISGLLEQIQAARSAQSATDDLRDRALRELLLRFKAVCETIAYAHSKGILHRDIKPGNIMLGKFGETLVVNWGLAKAFEVAAPMAGEESEAERTLPLDPTPGSLTPTAGPKGTPAYMSPEQAAARRNLRPASDVYGLGATLYCLLTGVPPFRGRASDVLEQVQDGKFPPPRSVKPGVPKPLEAICLKAMARDTDTRYASANELAADIDNWLADRPVTAWREPWSKRLGRWARRNRTAVAAAAAAALVGFVGLSAVSVVQARANRDLMDAKAATEDALAESKESSKQAEAVSEFLVEAFRSPDPTQDGRTVKVVDLLDGAANRLDTKFVGSQATERRLLSTLGQTYESLGVLDRAAAIYTKLLSLSEAALGPDHADTLGTRDRLAGVYPVIGRQQDAISLRETTLKLLEAKLGPDHPNTQESRFKLASDYQHARRWDEAIELLKQGLERTEARLGRDHSATLEARNDLAMAYRRARRLTEAIALYDSILAIQQAKLGPAHPDTLAIRHNLAIAYRSAGHNDDAIALDEATLKLCETELGPDHSDTFKARNDLAADYAEAGHAAGAVALHERTVKLVLEKFGPDAPETLRSQNGLAASYYVAGRPYEAIALERAALQGYESRMGPDHPLMSQARINLARALESAGLWGEAEEVRREILTHSRKTEKPDSFVLAADTSALGGLLLSQSRYTEAEPLLRESLAIFAKSAPDYWKRYHVMTLIGGSLLNERRFAEAEAFIVPGYEGMKAREARLSYRERPSLIGAAEQVVRLYESWNKPDQAAMWKSKLGMSDLPTDVFAGP